MEIIATITGRGPSIWDNFTHIHGKIVNDDTGDVATDSYHLYPEDINLLRALKVREITLAAEIPLFALFFYFC